MEISRLELWDISSIRASLRSRGTEDGAVWEFSKVQILAERIYRQLTQKGVLDIYQYCPFCSGDSDVKQARVAARCSIVAPTKRFLVGTWICWHGGPAQRGRRVRVWLRF